MTDHKSPLKSDVPPHKTGWKQRLVRLLAKLSLLAATLLVLFGLAEAALRIAGAKPRTATVLSGFFEPNSNSGWIGRPGVSMRFTTSDFDVMVNHDQDGFRLCGLDTPIGMETYLQTSTPRTEVIWCVGDSTTWGFGVADDKCYVSLLNKMSGGGVQFRNLGVPGYSSLQEYLLLKDWFERGQKPDEVLLMFATNDPRDNLLRNDGRPYFEIANGKALLCNHPTKTAANWRFRVWLKKNSLAYNYLSYYLARAKNVLRQKKQPGENQTLKANVAAEVQPAPAPVVETDELIALREAYCLIQELCAEHKVRLTVVMPVRTAMLEQVCGELEIPLIDVSPSLRQTTIPQNERQPIDFKHDNHWNEYGNRLVAEGLHARLMERRAARAALHTQQP